MIQRALSAHIARGGAVSIARGDIHMDGKARLIFPVLITAVIVFVVSAVVTFSNIGFSADFVPRWLKAFFTGWPVAAVVAFFAVPVVQRLTAAIGRLIDGPSPAP